MTADQELAHPDLIRLKEVYDHYAALLEDDHSRELGWGTDVDQEALLDFAKARVQGCLDALIKLRTQIENPGTEEQLLASTAESMWAEGFVVGYLARNYFGPPPPIVLDDAIDGSHRGRR